ncbi:uncharacterized protein LOC121053035 [Rosa chinensis]|uniref:uncharacterized protein LOC121053035 n=1 Tax=Rosa chinensis TaxID=74649 RepID=UPI001AD8E9D2|nr:uncharacterized protein LOC121053035 [Rosa chinensis]
MGQLASEMRERKQGELPSMANKNPRVNQAKAIITLRSGKEYDNKVTPNDDNAEMDEAREPLLTPNVPRVPPIFEEKSKGVKENLKDDGVIKDKTKTMNNDVGASGSKPSFEDVQEEVSLPFPQAMYQEKALSKKEKKSMECFDLFKKVEVNIPLLDAIKTIPTYAKFLKDLCTHKRYKNKLKKDDKVCLNERISAVLQRKLPPKLKDPRSFTIPCNIGERPFEKALLDLGASINLMPYGVYKELGLRDIKPIQISLQLADRSVVYPRGVVEDVLVQVDELVIPADFIILDMEEVYQDDLPIIFGRAFIATAGTKIDVKLGLLTMTVYDTTIGFKILDELRKPMRLQKVYSIEVEDKINDLVEHTFHETSSSDALKAALAHFGMDFYEESTIKAVEQLDSYLSMSRPTLEDGDYTRHEANEVHTFNTYLSIDSTPPIVSSTSIELKLLPSHLKYVYIDDACTLPLIISSSLSQVQESMLLEVLRKHKGAFGWSISDIKGLSPTICMHHIYMEDEARPRREPQRRLNPNMQEVVKKEVIKLLDNGVIYSISDSKWVSPIQVVPKKGGMTVVENEKGEMVLESVYRLPKAQYCHSKGSLPTPFHRLNA